MRNHIDVGDGQMYLNILMTNDVDVNAAIDDDRAQTLCLFLFTVFFFSFVCLHICVIRRASIESVNRLRLILEAEENLRPNYFAFALVNHRQQTLYSRISGYHIIMSAAMAKVKSRRRWWFMSARRQRRQRCRRHLFVGKSHSTVLTGLDLMRF